MHTSTKFQVIPAVRFMMLNVFSLESEAASRWGVRENPCLQTLFDSRAAWISDMIPTADGFVSAGGVSAGAAGTDIYILKLDSNCNKVWDSMLRGAGTEEAWAIAAIPDGGFVVAGETSSYGAGSWDAYLAKVEIFVGYQPGLCRLCCQARQRWSEAVGNRAERSRARKNRESDI